MKVYLVRVSGTYKIQGVFWARNLPDLWQAVDEMGDPRNCEYALMRRPSGIWHNIPYADTPEPPQDTDDESFDQYFKDMILTTTGELFPWMPDEQDSMNWRQFNDAFTGEGMVAQIRRRTP